MQHGFRGGLSTITQLVLTVHDLAHAINSQKQTDPIFLHFAEAFDNVSQPKLQLCQLNTQKFKYYSAIHTLPSFSCTDVELNYICIQTSLIWCASRQYFGSPSIPYFY